MFMRVWKIFYPILRVLLRLSTCTGALGKLFEKEDYQRKDEIQKTKKKILGCIFAEKLVLEKGKVATLSMKVATG
jgi:hypothetical protein